MKRLLLLPWQEIIDASLGNPSNDFLAIVDTIIEYEFQSLEILSITDSIAEFYRNFGNLLHQISDNS